MAPKTSEETIRLFNKTFGKNAIWQNIYSNWINGLYVEDDEKNILRKKNRRKISSKLCSEEGFSNKIKIKKEKILNDFTIYIVSKVKCQAREKIAIYI